MSTMYRNLKLKIACIAALLALSGGAHANIVDLFEDPLGGQIVDTDASVTYPGFSEEGSYTSIIGGYRDLSIIETADTDNCTLCVASMEVSGGKLRFNSADSVTAQGTIQWDGMDSSSSLDKTGMQVDGVGVNLVNQDGCPATGCDRFIFEVLSSDLAWNFTIGIYTDDDNWTEFDLVAHSTTPGGPYTSEILFAFFENAGTCGSVNFAPGVLAQRCGGGGGNQPVDMTDVGAMQVIFNISPGTKSLDFSIGAITKVPEPSMIGLLGLGLAAVGLVMVRRRRGEKSLTTA